LRISDYIRIWQIIYIVGFRYTVSGVFTRLVYSVLHSHAPKNEIEWTAWAGLVAFGACVRIAERAGVALVNKAQDMAKEKRLRDAKRD
jgi:spore maturation protein SpmA